MFLLGCVSQRVHHLKVEKPKNDANKSALSTKISMGPSFRVELSQTK